MRMKIGSTLLVRIVAEVEVSSDLSDVEVVQEVLDAISDQGGYPRVEGVYADVVPE